MEEYTFDSVLIDPKKEGIDRLVGKGVYFHDNPSLCIMKANQNSTDSLGVLVKIIKDSANPFRVEQNGSVHSCPCIIEKRKEKPEPKYVPFKDSKEFIKAYKNAPGCLDEEDSYLFKHGMWLKEKKRSGVYCMVNEIWNCGVDVGGNRISNEKNAVIKDFTTWENLYLGYTFLDGSPCGKVEDSNG